jgi:acid stress-induced BolA-like protein IbaG/YrbA
MVREKLEMSALLDNIKQTVENAIPQSTAYVLDPMNDGQHLQIMVISPAFEGVMLVKQHKMVMDPLKEALKTTIHALGVKTFTPQKWQESRSQFGL